MKLSRIDRIQRVFTVADLFPQLAPGSVTSVAFALLPARSESPVTGTVWTSPISVVSGSVTVLLAGPEADSTGALVVPATADLWAMATNAPETEAVKIPDRISVAGSSSLAALPTPFVTSVNGKTGAAVLGAADVGADAAGAATAAQAAAIAAIPSMSTIAADPTLRAALVPKWKASTAYASGEPVVNPSGQLVTANSAFTSGTTYDATKWTITGGSGTSSAALQKVAIFSDSMGADADGDGTTLATGLATALGVQTFSGAHSGLTSTEVATFQGGLDVYVTLPSNQIPATTGSVVVTVTPSASFKATNFLTFPGSLAGIPGILSKTGDTNVWKFQRNTAGSIVNISPETRFVASEGTPYTGWTQVFWVGRNNPPDPGTDAATIVRDVQAMVRGLTAAPTRYLVLPLMNGSGDTTVNTQLASTFGPNFFDLRGYLIRNGLALAGITPTTADNTAISAGNVPPSLLLGDGTHLTSAGQIIAINRLADLMVSRGWFTSYTPLTVPSASTPALTNTAVPTITGTTTQGSTLTASTGTWSATPDSYTYQWKRDGTAISGATATTYVVATADAGHSLTVTVIATKAGYTNGSATSAGTTIPALTTITNLATNPRGGVDTTSWSSSAGTGGTAALTAITTTGPTADAPTAVRQTYSVAPTAAGSVTHAPPITPSATYHVSCYVRPSWVGAKATLQIGWFNGGSFVGSSTPIVNVAATQNGWTRLDGGAVVLPAGVNTIKVIATIGSGSTLPGVGDTWDVTGVLIDGDAPTATLYAYKDGASSGWAWNGTAHASTSTGPDA